jgi:uncharacterized glyoxalase superfamily protein PhnB
MTSERRGPPPGQPTLSPYLAVNDAHAAIRYYVEAFGAVVDGSLIRSRDGSVGPAQLHIGDPHAVIVLADPWEVPGVDHPAEAFAADGSDRADPGDLGGD